MKKYCVLWALACLFSFIYLFADEDLLDEESQVPSRALKEIVYDLEGTNTIAYIILSDETVWRKNCSRAEIEQLDQWRAGDEIYITTNNQPGICLENIRDLSMTYAEIDADPLEVLPTITHIEIDEGGWFSSTEYYLYLSDATRWRIIAWAGALSDRWSIHQKVIVSKGWLKERFVNLNIPFDPSLPDDRSLLVEPEEL